MRSSSLLFGVAALFCVIFVLGFVSFSDARSSLWICDLTPQAAGVNNSWSGVAIGRVSLTKGANRYRFRVFGYTNIPENFTHVTINTVGNKELPYGAVIGQEFAYDNDGHFFEGDIRFSFADLNLLLYENMYLTVGTRSFVNGSLRCNFMSHRLTYLTVLEGAYETDPTNTGAFGLGIAYAYQKYSSNSQNLNVVSNEYLKTLALNVRTVHTATNVTHEAIYASAPMSQDGVQVVNLNQDNNVGSYDGFYPVSQLILNSLNLELAYINVMTKQFPNGEIRGQLRPLTDARRRTYPTIVTNAGTTSGTADTILRAELSGTENIMSDYMIFNPNSTGYHQSVLTFKGNVRKHNLYSIRGFILEMNLFGTMNQNWTIQIQNNDLGVQETIGYYIGTGSWDYIVVNLDNSISSYFNQFGSISFTLTSKGTAPLWVDQLSGRLVVPLATTAQELKQFSRYYAAKARAFFRY